MLSALLAPVGPAWAIPVGSDQDATGPQIASFSFSPNSVDVRTTSASIAATAHLTDDISGVAVVRISYTSASGAQGLSFQFNSSQRTSGTAQDGMYDSTLLVDVNREAGVWTVSGGETQDAVGNTRSYSAAQMTAIGAGSFNVQSNPDTTKPTVTAVRWSPSPLDVSAADGFTTFEWDVEDEGGSGVRGTVMTVSSPSGRQTITGQGSDFGTLARNSATLSGIGTTSTPAPPFSAHERGLSQFSEPGVWTINYVQVYDRASNVRTYQGDALAAILPAESFVVTADPTDVGMPSISAFRFSPSSIDVSTAPANLDVEFDVADELSGVQSAWVTFQSPTLPNASPQFLQRHGTFHQYLTAPRVVSGTVTGRVQFPTYDRSGDWTIVELCTVDRVKHQRCYTGAELAARGETKLTVIANEPPVVSVTGVVDGSTYSQHPTAGCSVVDREDGTITGVQPVRTGPVAGIFTLKCSYTDAGGKTGTSTVTYTISGPAGSADLALTKTGPVSANVGEELTYVIRVKNNGPDVATGVQVIDKLPAALDFVSVVPAAPVCTGTSTVVCNLGTLEVGEVKVVTIVARGRVAGPVVNDATVTANEGDPNPADNTGGWSTGVIQGADVSISKVARILTGPRLRYTIDVENLGPTVATGVVAKDILDPAWTLLDVETTQGTCIGRVICSIGTLAVGQKETVTITIGLTTPGPVHNVATVDWDGGTKETSADTAPFADLRVSKAHVGDFKAGQPGNYTVSVGNVGTGPTTEAIVVTDTLPTGMTFESASGGDFTCAAQLQVVTCARAVPLAAGASTSFTLTVRVALDAPRNVTNIITITGGGGVYQLEEASDPGGVIPPAALGVSKRVVERTVRIGHNLTYLIDVTNTGGQDATNVQVIDILPGSVDLASVSPGAPTCTGTRTITCNLGDLPVGKTVTVEIVVKPRTVTLLTNEASATADGIVVPATGSATIDVLPVPDLGVVKEASAPVVVQDSLLRYTITAKNLGPGDATNVKINDPLPTGVTLVSVEPDATYGMTCNVSAPPEISNLPGPVVCTVPLLPELTTTKVVLVVRVTRFGSLVNTASVTSDDPETGSGNDTSTVTVLVNRRPTADASGPYTVPEGGSVRLSGAGSDPDGDALTYAWDLDGDGIFETRTQNPLFSAATLDGPSLKTVALEVCDSKGACTSTTVQVTVTNVAPVITSVTNTGPVLVGTAVQITVVATDVAGPVRDPLGYEFDCDNNGTYEIGPQASSGGSCTFTKDGTYTVGTRVNDGDGGTATKATNVLVYAFPAAGQFVIGNKTNHAVDKPVTFWGSQWASKNPMSGGSAPTAFKGYNNNSAVPTCGGTWMSDPGNSSVPPAAVPQYLAVIVSSKIVQVGSAISGDIKEIVIIKTKAGYSPSPGNAGTGTVVAVLCKVN